jgi:hypothetical protein
MNLNGILHGFVRAHQKFLLEQGSGRAFPAKHGDVVMTNVEKNLPTILGDDFDAGDGNTDRIIQGSIIKCIDGRWVDRDGVEFPAGTNMLALGTAEALQHFQDGTLIETITQKSFPNINELNRAIPTEQWDDGINGPRPPWSHQYIAYLLDPTDAATYTFINNTVGAQIAVGRLTEKVKWMRQLRGARVTPLVVLDHRPMPTKHGAVKQRPEFTITEWRDLGGGGLVENKPTPQLPPAQGTEQIGKPVKPVITAEALNDELPF